MIDQRKLSKRYIFLNGRDIVVYIGRIYSINQIELKLSLTPKSNFFYGKYQEITITISKTRYNGKILQIYPRWIQDLVIFKIGNYDNIRSFKVKNSEIIKHFIL